jgi:tetratricopeptide (TPR) repeat protein
MNRSVSRAETTVVQKVLLVLFGIILVFLLEGALRLAHVGGNNSLYVRDKDWEGREVWVSNDALNKRLFFPVTGEKTNFPRPQLPFARFPVEKAPGTFRLFVVGASSVAAMPYAPNASFANFLRVMIAAGMPDVRVEGINTSMTAVSSYQETDWVDEILGRYDPDLVVVYTGHNEFYGVLAAGSAMSVGESRTAARLFLAVQKTAIYSLVAGIIEKTRRPPAGDPTAQPLESLTRDRGIRLESGMHRAAEENFRANLEQMVRRAEKAKVPIVLCTPACNRASCSPLGPIHGEGFPSADAAAWDRLLQTGDSRVRLGELEKASGEFEAALRMDSTHAGLLYRLGLVRRESGAAGEARRYFDRALLRDGVRLRASEPFVDIVRETVRAHEADGLVYLADVVDRFAAESPDSLTGSNLILEHVHLNGLGHYLAADEILEAALEGGLLPGFDRTRRLSFEEACRRAGFSALDEAYASSFTEYMLQRWPFKGTYRNEEQIRFMRERLREEQTKLDPIERAVFDAQPFGGTALHLHHNVGRAYLEAGEFAKAAEQFRTLTELLPILPDVQILYGRALLGSGRWADAEAAARQAVFLAPENAEARTLLAAALAGSGRREEARAALEEAAKKGLSKTSDPLFDPLLAF